MLCALMYYMAGFHTTWNEVPVSGNATFLPILIWANYFYVYQAAERTHWPSSHNGSTDDVVTVSVIFHLWISYLFDVDQS